MINNICSYHPFFYKHLYPTTFNRVIIKTKNKWLMLEVIIGDVLFIFYMSTSSLLPMNNNQQIKYIMISKYLIPVNFKWVRSDHLVI